MSSFFAIDSRSFRRVNLTVYLPDYPIFCSLGRHNQNRKWTRLFPRYRHRDHVTLTYARHCHWVQPFLVVCYWLSEMAKYRSSNNSTHSNSNLKKCTKNECEFFIRGSTEKVMKARRRKLSACIVSRWLEPPIGNEARVFDEDSKFVLSALV